MTRLLSVVALAATLVLIAIQFIRPALSNPPVTSEIDVPADVKQVLRGSCYSCHSNETELPWFDRVVPAYWLVARDVKQARSRLNFSEIGKKPHGQQMAALFEAVNQVQLGAMPLPSYLRVHPEARMTPEKIGVLRRYLQSTAEQDALKAPSGDATAEAQYQGWLRQTAAPAVQNAPNGIGFLPDYKDWKAISSTDRTDNNTMRVILGNATAVTAIAEHHINPWPDGSAFAKVAWAQQPDSNGLVKTGAFLQVAFMIKDHQKYAATKGWGFARWRGMNLKPYGGSASFTDECVGCHTPVQANDYVYTAPFEVRK